MHSLAWSSWPFPRAFDAMACARVLLPRRTRVACVARASASLPNAPEVRKRNVLVVGGGGREHALCWRLSQSASCGELHCAPGNFGIANEPGVCVWDMDVDDHESVVRFCKEQHVQLVVVGPEQPLVDGLADALVAAGVRCFGPSAMAARLEGSKSFMKELCQKYGIPTARYATFTDPEAAKVYIRQEGAPIVVKTDGLAAGKGVIVASTVEEACAAVDSMLVEGLFGTAGNEVVVEEFLDGEEASFFAIVGGGEALALASAQDHKAVGDGDTGPNTGGMGAYSPAPVLTQEMEDRVMETIVRPTIEGMEKEGCPFTGTLFAGLMIDRKTGEPKLLEHNIRFGDPECQCLMSRLNSDLVDVLVAACDGRLKEMRLDWSPDTALVVVMAAKGYPGSYKKGTIIEGLHDAGRVEGVKILHAGTKSENGKCVAAGGRVLGITAQGADVAEAQQRAYEAVDKIRWEDGFCRRDIGWRAVARLKNN